jgi:LPS export ABC transporter protein LptC
VPLILTRKQSMWLGLGLLGSFFLASSIIIYKRNQARIPEQAGSLTKEMIEGVQSPAPIDSTAPVSTPPPASGVGIVWNQFHRSLVQDGKMVWEIFGTRGEYDPAASIARIAEPDLTVIRDNGEKIRLTAGRAEINIQGTELTTADLFDNVVVTYQVDTTVKTSRATYNRAAGRVDIPVPVQLENPMFSVKGNKLVALLDPQEITISGGVQTIIKPRKK